MAVKKIVAPVGKETHIVGLVLLLTSIIVSCFVFFYHLSFIQVVSYLIGIFFFLYLPGLFVLHFLQWKDNTASLTILSILTGMAVSPILFFLASIVGLKWIFPLLIACASVFVMYQKRHFFKDYKNILRLPRGWWKVLLVFFILLAVLHCSHFTDLKVMEEGGYQLKTTSETIFHLGIINAVEQTIPPAFPYASGYKFSEYHIDMHLLAVIFCKYLGIDPAIMTFFFLPLLLLGMIMAVSAVMFHELHDDFDLSLFMGVFMLAADFSFMPAIWENWSNQYPWILTFCPSIWSLFVLNGIMGAIPLMFGAILAFQRFFTTKNLRHLIVFSLFTIAAYRYKNTMGLQLIGVGFATLLLLELKHHAGIWKKALPVLIMTAALIFADLFIKLFSSDNIYIVKWDAFNGLANTAVYLGIEHWRSAVSDPAGHPFILLGAMMMCFAGFMGTRLIFLKYCYDTLRMKYRIEPVVPFLIFFIVGGIVLSEMIFLSWKYNTTTNNAVWFRIQSIFAASYFVVAFLSSLKNKTMRIVAIVIVVMLSFPSTVQFLKIINDHPKYFNITQNQLLAVDYIKEFIPKDTVILEYPNILEYTNNPEYTNAYGPSLSANFAGKSVVFNAFEFVRDKVSPQVFTERDKDVQGFFINNNEEYRKMVLTKYGVEYLVIPSKIRGMLSWSRWAILSYNNPDVTVYKINLHR